MQIGEAIVPHLDKVTLFIENENEAAGDHIARILVHIGEPAVPSLIKWLKYTAEGALISKEKRVSIQKTIDILAEIGQPAVPYLIEMQKGFRGSHKVAAAMVLQKIDYTTNEQVIIQALARGLDDKYDYVRQWALGTCMIVLPKINDPAQEQAIILALIKWFSDDNENIRERAIEALIKIGEPAIPQLIEGVKQAMFKYDESARLPIPLPHPVQLLTPWTWGAIFKEVGGIRYDVVEKPVIPAYILTNIGKPAVPRLAEVLRDTSQYWHLRCSAALILGEIGGQDALPVLGEFTNDYEKNVAAAAVLAVSKFGSPAAPVLFQTIQKSEKWDVRELAELCLVDYVGKAAVPLLCGEVKDFNEQYCKKDVELLGKIGDPAALPLLNQALNFYDKVVQNNAEKAIKEIDKKQ